MSALTNPYSLEETLTRLRDYITAVKSPGTLELLDKAEAKAKNDPAFRQRMEATLLHGSTVKYRSLFADFGDYWAQTSNTIPRYPHADAVDLIDTAMFHIKVGDTVEAIQDFNLLHNKEPGNE